MSLRLYLDVNVPHPIARELRLRGVDVLTAQEDGTKELEDSQLLSRAAALGRALFTRGIGLLWEAARRQRSGEIFVGVIYAHQIDVSIGQCVNELELIGQASNPKEWVNRVEYLPLK